MRQLPSVPSTPGARQEAEAAESLELSIQWPTRDTVSDKVDGKDHHQSCLLASTPWCRNTHTLIRMSFPKPLQESSKSLFSPATDTLLPSHHRPFLSPLIPTISGL